MPITVSLQTLNEEALVRILREPKNALIKQYQALLDLDGVKLEFTDDALMATPTWQSRERREPEV